MCGFIAQLVEDRTGIAEVIYESFHILHVKIVRGTMNFLKMLMLSANLDVTTQLFSRQKDRVNSLVVSRRDEETASESFMIQGF